MNGIVGLRSRLVARLVVVLALIAVVALTVSATPAPASAAVGPILSESFEAQPTLPANWRVDEFRPGVSAVSVVAGDAFDGHNYLQISSPTDNHVRVQVDEPVTPNSSYLFHAMVRARDASADNTAAALGVGAQLTASTSVRTFQWQPVDFYVSAGAATSVTLVLELGNFYSENHGVAQFDAVTFAPVANVPPGAAANPVIPPPPLTRASQLRLILGPSALIYVLASLLTLTVVFLGVRLRVAVDRAEPSRGQLT